MTTSLKPITSINDLEVFAPSNVDDILPDEGNAIGTPELGVPITCNPENNFAKRNRWVVSVHEYDLNKPNYQNPCLSCKHSVWTATSNNLLAYCKNMHKVCYLKEKGIAFARCGGWSEQEDETQE